MRLVTKLSVIVVITNLLLCGCDILPGKNEECEASKWKEEIEVLVRPVFYIYATNVADGYSLSSATKLTFNGSTQRILCSGDSGFKTAFTNTFSGNQLSIYVYQVFNGDLVKFYFGNDKDHLNVIWNVKAYFNDGSVFESDELIQNVYYKDIGSYSYSAYKYFELYLNDVKWFAVDR